jgi:hypothetical protein
MVKEVKEPFLAAAIFCEKILEEKDGTISAIRIANRIQFTPKGPGISLETHPADINIMALISFRVNAMKGKHDFKFNSNSSILVEPLNLNAETLIDAVEGGVQNIMLDLSFSVKREGVIWFDVLLDEELITRMPLRIQLKETQITR